jgi:hypothetical protein
MSYFGASCQVHPQQYFRPRSLFGREIECGEYRQNICKNHKHMRI